MKPGRLQEAAATLFLTTALISGANAYHHNEKASNAEGAEEACRTQGNQQQAAEWSTYQHNEESNRNVYLGLALSNLGLAATFGALGASSVRRRREEEQEAAGRHE